MKVDQHARPRSLPVGERAGLDDGRGMMNAGAAGMERELAGRLPGTGRQVAARAPFVLDVFGGVAEYAGALVLQMPLEDHACVVAECRHDGTLTIHSFPGPGRSPAPEFSFPLADLLPDNAPPLGGADGRQVLRDGACPENLALLGALAEGVRVGALPRPRDGVALAWGRTCPTSCIAWCGLPLVAAALASLSKLFDRTLDEQTAVQICRRVENDWLDLPVEGAAAAGALLGEPNVLMPLYCVPHKRAGGIPLPDDLMLLAVDCGLTLNDWREKYANVRAATFMGRELIDRIIRFDGAGDGGWDGHLRWVTVEKYVDCFRDRLPTKMKGREFLERFGEAGDPLSRINPDQVYKIRSRTEHHIYEHARAVQFKYLLETFNRDNWVDWSQQVVELLNASHWSYGQRCGLGSLQSDRLVTLIREECGDGNVVGAKLTGRGCGGTICVLVRSDERAIRAVERAVEAYERKTGLTATICRGSSPGALLAGARVLGV